MRRLTMLALTVVAAGVAVGAAGLPGESRLLAGVASPSPGASASSSAAASTRPPGTPVALVPLYPWGTDHNGTARMYATQVTTSGGVTTLTAVRDLTQKPALSTHLDSGVYPPIHYRSGAVHSVKPVTIPADRPLRIRVEAQVPSVKGTWPAIWLAGVTSWPPEIDLVEYIGSDRLLQNVFSLKTQNSRHILSTVSTPEAWHAYSVTLTPRPDRSVLVEFTVDDRPTGSLVANGLVGQRLWIVANLQTERWSGTPGPQTATMRFRNLTVS